MIYCANCEHGCSPAATMCPACGHPLSRPESPVAVRNVVATERTGKAWKLAILIGSLLTVAGGVSIALAFMQPKPSPSLILNGGVTLGAGLLVSIIARTGAWWFHG